MGARTRVAGCGDLRVIGGHRAAGAKGISRQLSVIGLSAANFRIADYTGVILPGSWDEAPGTDQLPRLRHRSGPPRKLGNWWLSRFPSRFPRFPSRFPSKFRGNSLFAPLSLVFATRGGHKPFGC